MLTEAIRILKKARKQETGRITSLTAIVALLQQEMPQETLSVNKHTGAVRERISVVVDALAFHAGEICDNPETIHGVIRLLSEIRYALNATPDDE